MVNESNRLLEHMLKNKKDEEVKHNEGQKLHCEFTGNMFGFHFFVLYS